VFFAEYPWTGWRNKKTDWLFFANNPDTVTAMTLTGDLIQLMFVWSQTNVFQKKDRLEGVRCGAD
jgi:hypothetical protein